MSKRKLSAEEKREKLLEFFHETNDVFQLKDLENIVPKKKGIVKQSVMTTLQELVDNGKVCSEKIAGSNYYWAFPSTALADTKCRLTQVEEECNALAQKIEHAKGQLALTEKLSQYSAETEVITAEIEKLKKEKCALEERAKNEARDVDYAAVTAKAKDNTQLHEAANRWTDNIFSTKSWCKRKFDKEDRELNKAFGIPDDLDYIND